jgi:ribonuclease BN (tRNA processing enzyme)
VILKVAGCFGSELPGHRSAGFLVNGRLLLEAGTATSVLSLEEQLAVTEVCVSHAHLDHVKELPFLVDNRFRSGGPPLRVTGVAGVVDALRRHLFNDRIWPDFTLIPSRRTPALRFRVVAPGRFSQVGGLAVKPVAVDHPVQATGFILREPGTSVLYTGDTGPTVAIWKAARALPDLKAVIVECSFPNALEAAALASGHLTPRLLERQLELLGRPEVPVYLYHMKPLHLPALAGEVAELSRPVEMLRQGLTYTFC